MTEALEETGVQCGGNSFFLNERTVWETNNKGAESIPCLCVEGCLPQAHGYIRF